MVMLKLSNYFPFSFFRRTSGGTGTDFSLKSRLNSRRSGTREERQMTWMIPNHKQSLYNASLELDIFNRSAGAKR